MIDQAIRYVPSIRTLKILRIWTGFRPASPDDRPWIGAIPGRPGVFIASGHEGLGITSAMGTAELLTDIVMNAQPRISNELYDPATRLVGAEKA